MDSSEGSEAVGLPAGDTAWETDGDDERIAIRDDDGDESDGIAPADDWDADGVADGTPAEGEDVAEISGEAMGVIEAAGDTGRDGERADGDAPRRSPSPRVPVAAAALASACLLVALGTGLAAGGAMPQQEPSTRQDPGVMRETRPGGDSWQSEEVAGRLLDERMRLTEAQRSVLSSANSTSAAGPSMCLAWVNDVFDDAGCGFERLWAASEACQLWCDSTDEDDLEPGMIVAVESTDTSPVAGHIGIYIGGGKVRNNETWGGQGIVRTRPLDEWLEMFGKVAQPRWGWAGGRDLSLRAKGEARNTTEPVPKDTAKSEAKPDVSDMNGTMTPASDAEGDEKANEKKDGKAARQE